MAYYSILCHTIPYYSIIRETDEISIVMMLVGSAQPESNKLLEQFKEKKRNTALTYLELK